MGTGLQIPEKEKLEREGEGVLITNIKLPSLGK